MQFALGPILYFWSAERLRDFYDRAAQSSAQVVYLGETVCAKRRAWRLADYLATAHQLREAGKEVVLSSMTLLESPADLRELQRYCDNGEFTLEANDMGAVGLLSEQRLPFVAGAALNAYNQYALRKLVSLGMRRWVMPVELSRDWLATLLAQPALQDIRSAFEVEVFAFGHLPLAWSARCFTARSENRPKDACELCCINYLDGKAVHNQEGRRLFTLNGIQTQSGTRYNLVNDLRDMAGLVDCVRLSPASTDTFDWLARFQANVSGAAPVSLTRDDSNGYWRKLAGIVLEESVGEKAHDSY